MTFREISRQMLRRSSRRYLLYFWCNVSAVALFGAFSSIFTNRDFMNPMIVNSMISSNIIAPSVFTAAFLLIFIPYSYGAFFRKRKSEYGILMTLGMREREVAADMLAQGFGVSIPALAAGLVLGTLLSLAFFAFIRDVIGIKTVAWRAEILSYAITAGVYLALVVLTLALQLLGFVKTRITDMLKARPRGERVSGGIKHGFSAGLALCAASAAVLLLCGKFSPSWSLLTGFGLMLAGTWLLAGCLKGAFPDSAPDPGGAFIRSHLRSFRTASVLAAGFVGTGIFLASLAAVSYPSIIGNAMRYSPYDLLYVQADGKNTMSTAEASRLLSEYGVSVSADGETPFLRNGAFNLFPASELNRIAGAGYDVKPGEYLALYQYDLKDGYEHEMNLSGTMRFTLKTGNLALAYAGTDVRVFFNRGSFADVSLVLNDADYKTMAAEGEDYLPGIIRAFRFADWRTSGPGLSALQKELSARNHCADAEQERYFGLSSKLAEYDTARQSCGFLFFVAAFVLLLFWFSSDAVIYFKMKAEAGDLRRMYRGVYRIGISETEMRKILKRKNRLYCLAPFCAGAVLGMFFAFAVCFENGSGLKGSVLIFAVLALLLPGQLLTAARFTRAEEKMLNPGGERGSRA